MSTHVTRHHVPRESIYLIQLDAHPPPPFPLPSAISSRVHTSSLRFTITLPPCTHSLTGGHGSLDQTVHTQDEREELLRGEHLQTLGSEPPDPAVVPWRRLQAG